MRSMRGLVMGFPFALCAMEAGLGFAFTRKGEGRWLRLGWRLGFGLGAGVVFIFPRFTFTMRMVRMFAISAPLICGWMRMAKAGFPGGTFTMKSTRGLVMGFAFNMKSSDSPVAGFLFTMESMGGLVAGVAFTFHIF